MSVTLDDARVVRVRLDTPEGRALRQALGLEAAVPELVRAYCLGEWKAAEDGQRPVLITTDDVDRMGDVIVPEGAILEHYRKNPVILWAHDYTLPPLGSAQWIKRTDHGILAKPRWASTEFAQQIKRLYDEGHMKAWSIGFLPKAWEDIHSKDTDKPGITGRRYTKWELLEFSAVPVPANPNALSLAIKSGLQVSASLVKQLGLPEREGADPKAIVQVSAGPELVVGHLKEGSARAEVTQQELDQVLTELADVKAELAAATQRIQALETEQPETVRIRIVVDGETEAHTEPVIRVAGASLTKAELAKVLGEAIDGRIRKLTGVVS